MNKKMKQSIRRESIRIDGQTSSIEGSMNYDNKTIEPKPQIICGNENVWTRRKFIKSTAGLSLAALTTTGYAAEILNDKTKEVHENNEFFKFAWRIKTVHWTTDHQFSRLRSFLNAHHGIVSEISLFVGNLMSWHGYTEPDEDKAQFALAAKRMMELRKDGFLSVGFNLWPTFGSEGQSYDTELTLPPMVGYDGNIAKHIICPSSPKVLDYLSYRFELLASHHPGFIWVDDDARMAHLGLSYPCFCNICLAEFQEGTWKNRKELVEALNNSINTTLREAWINYNAYRLERVCSHVKQAVHSVDKSIDLGFMTVGPTHSSYSGDYIRRCMNVLDGSRGRPGHGFYTDYQPRDILRKAMDVGWQIAEYPDNITDIQYEFEDWPSITLEKANTIIAAECTLAVAQGCTGVAFSTFPMVPNSFQEYKPLMKRLEFDLPYLQRLSGSTASLSPVGLWLPWTPFFMARRVVNGKWFSESYQALLAPLLWCEFGIPLSADRHDSCGTILAGDAADAFTTEELKTILSGPVLMDVPALKIIIRHGLASLAGVLPKEEFDGAGERLSNNTINDPYIDAERNTIFQSSGWTLETTGRQIEVFSDLIDLNGINRGPCMTGYVNERGGRVVVMGYKPWERIGTDAKLHQMREVVDWATNKRIPVKIDLSARIAAFVRTNETHTKMTAVFFNNGFDEINNIPVVLRTSSKRVEQLDGSGNFLPIKNKRQDDGCIVFIEKILPWHTVVIVGS
jgi:hypothetical protein